MVAPNTDPNQMAVPRARTNPYIGPRPFKQKHQAFFFGREEEARALLARLVARGLLVFYAPSGAGKSSLINARLIPDLKQRGYEVLPVARVGQQLPAGIAKTDVSNVFVFNLLRSLAKGNEDARVLTALRRQELKEFLAQLPPPDGQEEEERTCRVLIIDQLEEIFTRHPEQWERRNDFFRQLREAVEADRSLLLLLALREDYVARLDRYAPIFPNALSDRYRMEKLQYAAAVQAVIGPTKQWIRDRNLKLAETAIFPPLDKDRPNPAAALLVENLRRIRLPEQQGEPDEFVEAVQLQVICQRLWENLKGEMPRAITPKDIEEHAKVEVALEEFYEQILAETLVKFPTLQKEEGRVREWFSGKLITANGIRAQINEEKNRQGEKTVGGLPYEVVMTFVKKSLVRYEDERNGRWYELSHDSLIAPIRKSNSDWMGDSPLLIAAQQWAAKRAEIRAQDKSHATRLYQYSASFLERYLKRGNDWWQWIASWYWRRKLGGYLYSGQQLAAAEAWAHTHPGLLTETVEEFIQESGRAETARLQQQQVWLVVTLAGILLLAAACIYALSKRQEAIQQARLASSRELSAYAHSLLAVAPERNLLLALEAMQQQPTQEAQSVLSQSVLAARLKTVFPQSAAPRRVAFAPEGNRIALVNEQGTATVIDTISGAELASQRFPAPLLTVIFSPDGKQLAMADRAGTAYIVNASDLRQEVARITHPGVLALAFSPDGRWLATGSTDRRACVWEVRSQQQIKEFPVREFPAHGATVNAVAFSPDGGQLATACGDGYARVWELITGNLIREYYSGEGRSKRDTSTEVQDVCFSPDGQYLAMGGSDGIARIWQWHNEQQPPYRLRHGATVLALAFCPGTNATNAESLRLATASRNGTVKVWSVIPEQELLSLTAHAGAVVSLAYSPDGKLLLTGGPDPNIKLWYAAAGHSAALEDVTYNSDNTRLATLDSNGRVIMWDTATSQPLLDFDASLAMAQLASAPDGSHPIVIGAGQGYLPEMKSLAFNPDGGTLAVAGSEGVIIFNANFGDQILPLSVPALSSMALSPRHDLQQRRLATGDGRGTLNIRELWSKQRPAPTLYLDPAVAADSLGGRAHEKSIKALTYSPGRGQWLASASEDKTVKIWDEAGALQATLTHPGAVTSVAFSANGQAVVAACVAGTESVGANNGVSLVVWDWQTKTPRWKAPHPTLINDVAFSPDEKRVATADADGVIRLWDFRTGQKLQEFLAHEGSAKAIAFSAKGNILATAGEDKALRIHYLDLPSADLLALARSRLALEWSPDDCLTYLHQPCTQSAAARGVHAFLQGRQLALYNDSQAAAAFDRAQSLYPVLQLDSQAEATRLQRQGDLERQLNLTSFKGTQGVTGEQEIKGLAKALAAVPGTANSGQDILLLLGEQLARQGKIPPALLAYDEAVALAPNRTPIAAHWNNLCWYGSLWSFLSPPYDARLLQAGKKAVEMEPENVNYRDTRGLARALTGDYQGAIEDFEAYLNYVKARQPTAESAKEIAQRQRWLTALRQYKAQAFTVARPEIKKDIEQLRRE